MQENNIYTKTELLLGTEEVERLKKAKVLIAGLGGVGSYAAEAIVRSGVGDVTLVDKDTVDITNTNRQIYALTSTLGKNKTDVAAQRCLDINPCVKIKTIKETVSVENISDIIEKKYDFVVDAIDDVSAKTALIKYSHENNIPVITCMGMGNKTDISKISLSYIEKTHTCPLARIMRKKLREEGIKNIMCVFSSEEPKVNLSKPSSVVFVPAAAGLMMAQYVVMSISAG